MSQERTTRLVRHIRVRDTAGRDLVIEEWGDFMRVQTLDSGWSEWMRTGGRLKLNGKHVNPTDSPTVFELVETGERLTAVAPPG